ncbi:hypothetical protein VP01_7812g1 [Puccinia sorghi]|uniref:Uncharacterized protein n=1 Tax=Puccinia sorghi TaxID=27349 RepID=A0A0L6UB43_9BASI|nr:hypothetical protein VP01_7812g1 [Puccinia sorghi]
MCEDDFSLKIENPPSLSQLNTWLENAYTNQCCSPETSRYHTKPPGTTASSLPPPSGTVASSVPLDTNIAAQENTEDSDEDKFKINIEYLFFFEEEKKTKQPTNSQSANKRKVAPDSEGKYQGLPSNWGKLSLMWSANNPISQLKLAAIKESRFRDAAVWKEKPSQ